MPHSVFENLPKLTCSLTCFGRKAHSLPFLLPASHSFRKVLLDKTKSNTKGENTFSL